MGKNSAARNLPIAAVKSPIFAPMFITPEVAQDWLNKNYESNRKLRTAYVERLAAIMKRGEWKLTHQGIAFDVNDKLIDGQHRLWAVVESGVSVQMMVARNMPTDTFSVLDQNATRNMSDLLSLPKKETEMVRWIADLNNGLNSSPTSAQVQALVPVFYPQAHKLMLHAPKTRARLSSIAIRVAAMLRSMESDEQYVLDQYRSMTLLNLDALSTSSRNFVSQMLGPAGKEESKMLFARAWNAFDPTRQNMTRILVKDPDNAIEAARSLVARLIKEA